MSTNFVSCQPLLDRLTHVMNKTKLMAKFKKLSTLEEKMYFCLQQEKIKYDENTFISMKKEISDLLQAFYLTSQQHGKSEETAEQLKTKGSKAFMKKKDEEAYRVYTDALRHAPSTSPILAVLYANRSAAHIQQKRYEECLEDIERAESAGYPPESQYKLHRRKLEAQLKLRRGREARRTLQRLKECHFPVDKGAFLKSVKELEKQFNQLGLRDDKCPQPVQSFPKLYLADKDKQISGALGISVNDKEGRHVIATSDIPKGVTLFRESPYAAILLPGYSMTHCQCCFNFLNNPIPCSGCSDVFWCGEECQRQGMVFHEHECRNLHVLSSVGIAHLAFRIIVTAGWPICQQVREEVKQASNTEDPTTLFQSRDAFSRYKAVFSLLTHLDRTPPEDLFQYCLAGIILGKVIMERTQFLPPEALAETSIEKNGVTVQLSSLLVHHISQLVSNAHAVTQIERKSEGDTSPLSQISQKRVASAIYPVASLMNHSCKPPIINSFMNDILVIHAVEKIPSGSQVFNCYGPHASRQERTERQTALQRQYFFQCTCDSCTSDEALIKEASWSGVTCPHCNGIAVVIDDSTSDDHQRYRCLSCKSNETLPPSLVEKCADVNTLYEDGQEALKVGNYELAEESLIKALRLGETVFTDNNEFLNTIRDTLAKSYTLAGKYGESLRELSLCIKAIGRRFGDENVEVAHELLKYLDVIGLDRQLNHNPEKVRRRIDRIFTTHYGPNWRSYLKLSDI